jgi:hypothetical protein
MARVSVITERRTSPVLAHPRRPGALARRKRPRIRDSGRGRPSARRAGRSGRALLAPAWSSCRIFAVVNVREISYLYSRRKWWFTINRRVDRYRAAEGASAELGSGHWFEGESSNLPLPAVIRFDCDAAKHKVLLLAVQEIVPGEASLITVDRCHTSLLNLTGATTRVIRYTSFG